MKNRNFWWIVEVFLDGDLAGWLRITEDWRLSITKDLLFTRGTKAGLTYIIKLAKETFPAYEFIPVKIVRQKKNKKGNRNHD